MTMNEQTASALAQAIIEAGIAALVMKSQNCDRFYLTAKGQTIAEGTGSELRTLLVKAMAEYQNAQANNPTKLNIIS